MTPETVLVLGGRHTALAALRELSAAGYHVVVGDGGYYSVVRHSRYCKEVWRHPPATDSEALVSALASFLSRRPDVTHVLPLDDRSVGVLSRHRDRLPAQVVLVAADRSVVESCLDKRRLYAIAAEAGVPLAPIREVTHRSDVMAVAEAIGFPCVVRPAEFAGPMPWQRKALIFRIREDVVAALAHWPEPSDVVLIQRYVAGDRHNLWFVARDGRLLASLQARTLRTDTTDGTGLRMDDITVAPGPRFQRHLVALIERLDYTGVGGAQFILPEVGESSLLEINPRPSGSGLPLLRLCGMPHVLAAISVAAGTGKWQPDPDFRYPLGRRSAWTSRDLYGLARAISRREVDLSFALRWFGSAISTAIHADAHQVWSRRDPTPALAVYAHLLTLGPWRRRRVRA